MKQSVYKVPDGKLIKVKLWVEHETILKVVITGDFFLHPETVLEMVETNLIGVELQHHVLTAAIDEVLWKENAVLIGVSSSNISRTILEAE